MSVLLGIDTGGTYTDAVLLGDEHDIIATAKALTTKYDLSVGIKNAVQMVLPHPPPDIQLVSLSTTLATNAIVEGQGSSVCLLLIGYEPDMIADSGVARLVDRERIVYIPGGHAVDGQEQCPLDINAARQAISAHAPYVAAFAISGYFGVRNPTHELRVKQLVRRLTSLPVTCGHELTTNLDAPRRALTVALNARLIALLQQLILGVQEFLVAEGINAPLMVVRGDGSLMDAKVALERPVETITSGPAASVIGALNLCNVKDGFVIDMGGTTTDIAIVHDGHPVLNHKGARVGSWQTMVEAVDIRTTGLGGDSEIHQDESGNLGAGPRRVVPLSMLAMGYPGILEVLRGQQKGQPDRNAGHFVMRERPLRPEQDSITTTQHEIWELLNDGPVSIAQLRDRVSTPMHFGYSLDGLMERGLIVTSAFTPTDAVHVLGQYCAGSTEAAELGAELWTGQLETSKASFCQCVVNQVKVQAGYALIESALADESSLLAGSRDNVWHMLVSRALGMNESGNFDVSFKLRSPIIGIGAPAATYLRPLAGKLNTPIYIPEHAEVASAIGAAAGAVVQNVCILIQQPWGSENAYRVYLPFGVRDFTGFNDAVAYASRTASRIARTRARQSGATRVKLHARQDDRIVWVNNERIYLGTDIMVTAVGRPRLKE
jgi:N-methylhydantoinase A/oxoprolinase/acetone carboxylase beta subunit